MPQRNSYTFKEGLTLMAAKAVGIDPDLAVNAGDSARSAINALRHAAKAKNAKDKAALIREAQKELQSISAAKHPKLVNALQARPLALQGRGQDTEVAHVEPGEMVIPRAMLTPKVLHLLATEAARRGIDPKRLMVGGKGSINPATGEEEFGVRDWLSGLYAQKQDSQPRPSFAPRAQQRLGSVQDEPNSASPAVSNEQPATRERGPISREGEFLLHRYEPCARLSETERYDNPLCKDVIEPIKVKVLPAIPADDDLSQMSPFELHARRLQHEGIGAAVNVGSRFVPTVTPYGQAFKQMGRDAMVEHMDKVTNAYTREIERRKNTTGQ